MKPRCVKPEACGEMRVSTRVQSNHLNTMLYARCVTTLSVIESPYNIDLLVSREKQNKKINKKRKGKNEI